MFDDIIRFLLVFIFLLAPYTFVFYSVFGGQHIIHNDYDDNPNLCEKALLNCPIIEIPPTYDGTRESLEAPSHFLFNETFPIVDNLCYKASNSCRLIETDGFDNFYALVFSMFRVALVDDGKILFLRFPFSIPLSFQYPLIHSI